MVGAKVDGRVRAPGDGSLLLVYAEVRSPAAPPAAAGARRWPQ